jgi:hypothetical protein
VWWQVLSPMAKLAAELQMAGKQPVSTAQAQSYMHVL